MIWLHASDGNKVVNKEWFNDYDTAFRVAKFWLKRGCVVRMKGAGGALLGKSKSERAVP